MSNRQRRPLNGGLANGTPTELPAAPSSAAVLHHTDATPQSKGGPFIDEVTLFVANTHTAAKSVTIDIGGTLLTVSIAPGTFAKVLDGQPLVGSQAASPSPVSITAIDATGGAGALVAWGYFER